MVDFMSRITINIAIVDMVQRRPPLPLPLPLQQSFDNTTTTLSAPTARQRHSIERLFLSSLNVDYAADGFAWDEQRQSQLVGAFFWILWLTQIPASMLTKRYGPRRCVAITFAIIAAGNMAIPMAAFCDARLAIGARVIQGAVAGSVWPSFHALCGQWVPPDERSRFVTAYLGSSTAVALFYPIFGWLITVGTWEWVFHLCGLCAVVWTAGWLYCVYDAPALHPRVGSEERLHIETSLGLATEPMETDDGEHRQRHRQQQQQQPSIPWLPMMRSRAVWAVTLTQCGHVWSIFTLMTQAPTYFRHVHGISVSLIGVLCGFPHALKMAFGLACAAVADRWLLRRGLMSRTNVRKWAAVLCCCAHGAFVCGLAAAGTDLWMATAMQAAALMVHGAVTTGPLACIMDLTPNYSGVLLALTSVVSTATGCVSPFVVGWLTMDNVSCWWHFRF